MKVIKTFSYKKNSQENISGKEIFRKNLEMYKDPRKAAEATLDMLTGGVFAAVESISREKFIDKALEKWIGRREIPSDTPMGLEDDNPVPGIDY